jgi:hypothetical protein
VSAVTTRTFEGGCHCGRVRFAVTATAIGPDDPRVLAFDCNCSICTKKGFLHLIVDKGAFTLVSGAADIATYTFKTGVAKHTFCRVCGVHPFYTPRSHPDGIDVNVRCLDVGLDAFRISPFDGQNWEASVDAIR